MASTCKKSSLIKKVLEADHLKFDRSYQADERFKVGKLEASQRQNSS
jgi:hypothetical protein